MRKLTIAMLTIAAFCFVSVPIAFSGELVKVRFNDATVLSSSDIAANLERQDLSKFAGAIGNIIGESRSKCGGGYLTMDDAIASSGCGFGGIGDQLAVIITSGKFAGWDPRNIADLLVKFRDRASVDRYMKVVEEQAALK